MIQQFSGIVSSLCTWDTGEHRHMLHCFSGNMGEWKRKCIFQGYCCFCQCCCVSSAQVATTSWLDFLEADPSVQLLPSSTSFSWYIHIRCRAVAALGKAPWMVGRGSPILLTPFTLHPSVCCWVWHCHAQLLWSGRGSIRLPQPWQRLGGGGCVSILALFLVSDWGWCPIHRTLITLLLSWEPLNYFFNYTCYSLLEGKSTLGRCIQESN